MNCTSYYVHASHHFKPDLVYSTNSLKAGVFCHSPIYRWVGGRVEGGLSRSIQSFISTALLPLPAGS